MIRRVIPLVACAAVALLATPAIAAASAPAATTGGATGVADSAARLAGTVNANGEVRPSVFQSGKTTSSGAQTPAKAAGSGTTGQSVSDAIAGLSPSTTYHYRIVATNPSGSTQGDDKTLTT